MNKHPLQDSLERLRRQLESSYAVTAPNLPPASVNAHALGFLEIIFVPICGNLVECLKKKLEQGNADSNTLVVCTGRIPAAQGQLQARQFKSYVERFRFSPNDRGPAFLLLGKSLTLAMEKESDLTGRIFRWEAE